MVHDFRHEFEGTEVPDDVQNLGCASKSMPLVYAKCPPDPQVHMDWEKPFLVCYVGIRGSQCYCQHLHAELGL